MGSFLLVLSGTSCEHDAKRLFSSGLTSTAAIKKQTPSALHQQDAVHVAVFSRQFGRSPVIPQDTATGSWLAAIGTWFTRPGLAAGREEELLARYLDVGAERLANELEGFFVVAIGDNRTKETLVLTDVIGSCHAFIRELPHGTALSGSSAVLAAMGQLQPDPVGVQEFLHNGIIYEDRTIYRDVHKLPPGSILRFREGKLVQTNRYWRAADVSVDSIRGDAAADLLWDSLTTSAKKIGAAFPRLICDLTGGYDSRAVAAGLLGGDVRFAAAVSGADSHPDVKVSRLLASAAGLKHLHSPPDVSPANERELDAAFALTDGEYELTEYARIRRVHERLAQEFDVSINGSIGELARGYWWELLIPHTGDRRPIDPVMLARNRFVSNTLPDDVFEPGVRVVSVAHMASVIRRTNQGLEALPNTRQMDNVYLMLRMQRWQGRIASSTNQLWPCLSPFLMRPNIEAILQTDSAFRKRSLLIRAMLSRHAPQWCDIPLEHGYPPVPATATNFGKFVLPLSRYYGGKIRGRLLRGKKIGVPPNPGDLTPISRLANELLDPEMMLTVALFDPVRLRSLLEAAHRGNPPKHLLRLLTVEYALRHVARASASASFNEPRTRLAIVADTRHPQQK